MHIDTVNFMKAGSGTSCIDIDECEDGANGGCDDICVNSQGKVQHNIWIAFVITKITVMLILKVYQLYSIGNMIQVNILVPVQLVMSCCWMDRDAWTLMSAQIYKNLVMVVNVSTRLEAIPAYVLVA